MGGIAIHYLAKTKLGIKTYENLSELHTQTDVPSCIKSVVIQSVITECVYFVITINMDASNGCVTIEFSLTTYSASQIRACRDDKVGVICNIKTKLYVNVLLIYQNYFCIYNYFIFKTLTILQT